MKEINAEQYWANLIARYLSGNANEQETRALMQWIDQSEENREYFEGMQKLWNITDIAAERTPDVDGWWRKTSEMLGAGDVRRVPIYGWYRVAAAAAVLLLMLFAAQFVKQSMVKRATTPVLVEAVTDSLFRLVQLPDNSRVWLRGGSDISFQAGFSPRKVLLKGEAFFDVTSNPGDPFEVVAGEASVQVLGTRFNVKQTEKGQVELYVEEGKVAFGGVDVSEEELEVLTVNQGAIFDRETFTVERLASPNLNMTSWKSGSLVFRNTPLKKVLHDLEDYYGKKYMLTDSSLVGYDLTAEFNNRELYEVIEMMEFMLNIRIIASGDTLRIAPVKSDINEE